jgi:hypothetical protein
MCKKKVQKIEKCLREKIQELLETTSVAKGSYIEFSEASESLLLSVYGVSKEYNDELADYTFDNQFIAKLILDYFLKAGEYSNDEEVKSFNGSNFYANLDTHIQHLVDIIASIPIEYEFVLPLMIKDSRFATLDEQIYEDIHLKGLDLDPSLYWQYMLADSGYGTTHLDKDIAGENLCITGIYKGYVFKYIPNTLVEEYITTDIKKILSLLTFTNIIKVEYATRKQKSIRISIYKEDDHFTDLPLEISLEYWIEKIKLTNKAFEQQAQGLLSLLGAQLSQQPTEIENFINNLKEIKNFKDIKDSDVVNTKEFKKFNTALDWYLNALTSESLNDRLINLFVILEIFLGSANHSAVKRVELPERVSLLLGKTTQERKDLAEITRDSQNKRNAIMHDGETLSKSQNITLINDFHTIIIQLMRHELELLHKSIN